MTTLSHLFSNCFMYGILETFSNTEQTLQPGQWLSSLFLSSVHYCLSLRNILSTVLLVLYPVTSLNLITLRGLFDIL